MTCGHTDPAVLKFLYEEHTVAQMLPFIARRESTGFIINRIWAAIKREVLMVLAEGVSEPAEIDKIWIELFKSKYAPCSMMDTVGLDTVMFIEQHYVDERHLDGKLSLEYIKNEFVVKGKLGAKSGKGGLYPPGYSIATVNKHSHHDQQATLTLYFLDLGDLDGFEAGKVYVGSGNGTYRFQSASS